MSSKVSSIYNLEKLYSKKYVRDLLAFHKIHLKKSLGQNFLVDKQAVERITRMAKLDSDDVVLEIGPGIGHLTHAMLQKVKHVISIEIDQRLFPVLTGLFGDNKKLTLVEADILKVNLKKRFEETGIFPNKVVANVPYYITTPILTHLVDSKVNFEKVLFTVQKEVAERYVAPPGNKTYGSISVVIQYWGTAKICGDVAPQCFFPIPKVTSAVLSLDFHKKPIVGVANEDLFYKIIKMAFSQRRKMLKNTLLPLEKEGYNLKAAFETSGIDETLRAEKLSVENFAKLSDALICTPNLFC